MIRIEPLGTRCILPAILVGYEFGGGESFDDMTDSPSWLVTIFQQAGGMSMSYPSAIGVVLRFAANADHALIDPAPLIRGFQLMGEDALDIGVLRREFPLLSRLVQTQGQDYSTDEITRLNGHLRRYYWLPKMTDGLEAFVRSEPFDPLEYFAEWAVMSAVVRTDRPTRMLYQGQKAFSVDDSNLDDVILTDDILFCEVAHELAAISSQLPSRPQLRAFLLWENSD